MFRDVGGEMEWAGTGNGRVRAMGPYRPWAGTGKGGGLALAEYRMHGGTDNVRLRVIGGEQGLKAPDHASELQSLP